MKIASIYILMVILVLTGQKTAAMMEKEEIENSSRIHKLHEKLNDKESSDKIAQTHQLVTIDKLTKEHCQKLKEICSHFVTKQIGIIPLNPRSGWINKEDLDDLTILCLEQKKWKNDVWLTDQMQKALKRFYHFTENLLFISGIKLVKDMGEQLSKDILKIGDPLKAASLISGFHETSHSNMEDISPYVPIIQKMMYTLAQYYSEVKKLNLDPLYGTIPVGEGKILAYVKGYFPLSLLPKTTSDDYEIFRLPYPGFCGEKQGVCLVNGKGQIISDTGLVIKHEDVYGVSLIKDTFVYCGIDNENPFTMSPFELLTVTDFVKENPSESLLKTFLGEDFPQPGKIAFIPLPEKQQEKDLIELIFLETLQEDGKKGDTDALRMIAYIEEETEQKLEQVIKDLTDEQLKIIEEQEKLSKAVSEDQIVGRVKKKDKPTHKSKNVKKSLSSNKKDKSLQQHISLKSLDQKKSSHDKLKDLIERGRPKYRKVVGMINRIMKHSVSHTLTEGNKGGSHKTIHSDKGVVTSVRPHGKKDLTIPGQRVKRFTERLLNILDL